MTTITLHEGDNREHLRRLIDQGVRVHAVVTDPPYGLTSIGKRFGADNAAPAKFGSDGAFARASKGFMGTKWDGTGIERDPEFWRLIHDILLPGGYVLAFSSPRTGHWQACAMETAGFVMHPFLGWLYGSGMPKAHSAAMAIDKSKGLKGGRGAPKSSAHAGWIERGRMRGGDDAEGHEGWQRAWMADEAKVADNARIYIPACPEAEQWDGWFYGGQALKPALEPIYVGQKPFDGKTGPANFLKHGVGAINIAGCMVPRLPDPGHPSNILHDGSEDVVALFPATPGQQGRVTGSEPSGKTNVVYGEFAERAQSAPRVATGTAAEFFNAFEWPEIVECDPVMYHRKASKADKAGSDHPTGKPVALMRWLVRLVTPPGGIVLDPFAGSGSTAEAARQEGFDCLLMEGEPVFADDIRRRFALPGRTYSSDFDDLLGGEPAPDYSDLLG